jgi:hypothetical protein
MCKSYRFVFPGSRIVFDFAAQDLGLDVFGSDGVCAVVVLA